MRSVSSFIKLAATTLMLAAGVELQAQTMAPAIEKLSAAQYDRMLGNYVDENGCGYRVTRSQWRLYLENACAGEIVGLERLSALEWRAGQAMIPEKPYRATITFNDRESAIVGLTITPIGSAERAVHATRARGPRVQKVRFESRDGTVLAGAILSPNDEGKHPAAVIVHGSGEQDRHGYASIIDLLAYRFVDHGFVVLQYDKRGSGESKGDWQTASFRTLAEDAEAGRRLLMRQRNVNSSWIGLAGSSQAGWISAKAVQARPNIPFVALIGAAGVAMNVEEQNSYNAMVTMSCAGVPQSEIDQVLNQHRLFYGAKTHPAEGAELLAATRSLEKNKRLVPWLLPAVVERKNPAEWYIALETDFDPRPVWRTYAGRAFFAHGGLDDATPTRLVMERARAYRNRHLILVTSPSAQHLGLRATDVCHAEPEFVSKFDPAIWAPFDAWLDKIQSTASPKPT